MVNDTAKNSEEILRMVAINSGYRRRCELVRFVADLSEVLCIPGVGQMDFILLSIINEGGKAIIASTFNYQKRQEKGTI